MALRVACLLGGRANPWHSEVFHELPAGIEATIVGTTGGRYPIDEIGLPLLRLPAENEVGSRVVRRLRNLRYRLTHRLTGHELRLAPPGDRLSSFDVLDSWELFTDWTRVALDEKARRRVPLVITVWDNLPLHFADHPRLAPVRRAALAAADRFFVVTEGSETALLLEGVDPGRIVRARPSVDPSRFRPGRATGEMRARLGAKGSELVVLTVARLEAAKGVHHLLDGFALARREWPSLRVAVLGDGPEEGRLRERAHRLGIAAVVEFVGSRPYQEMPEVHRAADVFVLASVPAADWREQWGQSLLEAMATATASIGSASGGIPEVLGDSGILVPPGDHAAIAAALKRLAADPGVRSHLGKSARARVEARFTHREQARIRAELYRELAGEDQAGARG